MIFDTIVPDVLLKRQWIPSFLSERFQVQHSYPGLTPQESPFALLFDLYVKLLEGTELFSADTQLCISLSTNTEFTAATGNWNFPEEPAVPQARKARCDALLWDMHLEEQMDGLSMPSMDSVCHLSPK